MRKFLHIFLALALIVAQSPVSAFRHVAEATEDLPTYSNPMNGEAGANFTGAIKWLQDNNAFDTMQDVTVAILDDGVDVSNPYIDENAFLKEESKSFISGEGAELALKPPSYSDGHGTTMASVIGGKNGLGALSGVSGVNYISYRYYEYNYQSGDRRGIVDSEFRSQLLAALNSLYTYATTNEKGSELKVALITGAMSRAVKMILDETPNRIDTTKPRRTEMGDNAIYYYDEEIGFNDKDSESGFDDVISQDRELETAIMRLHNAGVSVVVAENNLTSAYSPGDDSTLSACPAFYDGALAVTAVNNNKEIASWPGQREVRPDYTPNTDIAGYGSNENAADWWVAASGANATSSHVSKTSGTSIAAAQVAAAIALTAKSGCVGKQGTDWTGTDAEYRIMQVLNNLEGTRSPFNGTQGVLDVYSAISTYADGTHYHTFDTGWTSDETGHWHKCIGENCDNQENIKNFAAAEYGEHTFGSDNKCTVCGYERECPHEHTELINVKEATCSELGYTGDIYCLDCKNIIEYGHSLPKDPNKHKDNGSGVCEWCGVVLKKQVEVKNPVVSGDTRGRYSMTCNGAPVTAGQKLEAGSTINFSTYHVAPDRVYGNTIVILNRCTVNGVDVMNLDRYSIDTLYGQQDSNVIWNGILNNRESFSYTIPSNFTGDLNISFDFLEAQIVWRIYNPITREHVFTPYKDEYEFNRADGWKTDVHWNGEGVAWISPMSGQPVYRIYNEDYDRQGLCSHFLTADKNEADFQVARNGWRYDNKGAPVYYSGGSVNIYHTFNEGENLSHHYTKDKSEYDALCFSGQFSGWAPELDRNAIQDAYGNIIGWRGIFKALK